jgi:hypothetical protein
MTEIRVVDPKTGGEKGTKPERWDLIPPSPLLDLAVLVGGFDKLSFRALDELARVYAFGARKYSDFNWRKGIAWRLSIAALERHVSLHMQGQKIDGETDCLHLAHAVWHLFTLYEFARLGLGTDDRVKEHGAAECAVAKRGLDELWLRIFRFSTAAEHDALELLRAAEIALRLVDDALAVPSPPSPPEGWHPHKFAHGAVCDDPACPAPAHFQELP